MPLTVKAFRGKAPPSYVNIGNYKCDLSGGSDDDSLSQEDGELHIHQVGDAMGSYTYIRWVMLFSGLPTNVAFLLL